jgi:hypothetical protein
LVAAAHLEESDAKTFTYFIELARLVQFPQHERAPRAPAALRLVNL